jgi:hypothetical protein
MLQPAANSVNYRSSDCNWVLTDFSPFGKVIESEATYPIVRDKINT